MPGQGAALDGEQGRAVLRQFQLQAASYEDTPANREILRKLFMHLYTVAGGFCFVCPICLPLVMFRAGLHRTQKQAAQAVKNLFNKEERAVRAPCFVCCLICLRILQDCSKRSREEWTVEHRKTVAVNLKEFKQVCFAIDCFEMNARLTPSQTHYSNPVHQAKKLEDHRTYNAK